MPLASLANLQWNGPASLAVVDDATAEESVQPKAYNNVRSASEDAVSGAAIAMTRVRSMELNDDSVSSEGGSALKQVSSIRFSEDVGANPSAFAIAQEVWNAASAALNAAGTMGEKMNSAGGAADPWDDTRALTVAKFLGLK